MLELGYLLIFISLVLLIYIGIRKALVKLDTPTKKVKKITIIYFISIICWLTYLYLISFNGFIYMTEFPPRFPILIFIPVIAIIIYLLYSIKNSKFLSAVPKSWAVYFQFFRVIMEQLILFTFISGLIPVEATFQGYNYEVIFALTSPVIAYFSFAKKIIPLRITIAWNVLGIFFLFVVLGIMVTSFFFPEVLGYEQHVIDIRFTKLPLVLLPAFMVPSAIFMHLFSIMQLKQELKNEN